MYHSVHKIFLSMVASKIEPFSSFNDFIFCVLIPEIGLQLIMEDNGLVGDCGKMEGLNIMRESSDYGVAMFPDDDNEQYGELMAKGRN